MGQLARIAAPEVEFLLAYFGFRVLAVQMTSNDEYRKQATEAQKQADRARNDLDRESWLRVAQGWLSMIRKPATSAQERFDAETAAKRTDDSKDSDTSH